MENEGEVIVIGAVVLAAGSGKRMKAEKNKQYLTIAGRTMLSYAIESMAAIAPEIIIVAAKGEHANVQQAICEANISNERCKIVEGGAERKDSVYAGLRAIPESWEKVLIHDGARPFVPVHILKKIIDNIQENMGVVPILPVVDTIKKIDENGYVCETLPRNTLAAVQTPQGFLAKDIIEAHQAARHLKFEFTDDASIFEHFGKKIYTIQGHTMMRKMTVPEDMVLASNYRTIWEEENACRNRI